VNRSPYELSGEEESFVFIEIMFCLTNNHFTGEEFFSGGETPRPPAVVVKDVHHNTMLGEEVEGSGVEIDFSEQIEAIDIVDRDRDSPLRRLQHKRIVRAADPPVFEEIVVLHRSPQQ